MPVRMEDSEATVQRPEKQGIRGGDPQSEAEAWKGGGGGVVVVAAHVSPAVQRRDQDSLVGEHGRPNSRRESKDVLRALTNHVKPVPQVWISTLQVTARSFHWGVHVGVLHGGGVSSERLPVALGPRTGCL